MFIDYVSLMLVNMAAGFFLLASFVWKEMDGQDSKKWSPAFLLSGAIATLCGFRMTWTWPLPSCYNIPFGELSILFGALLSATALALAKGWDLKPLSIYGFFAGVAAVIVGIRFIHLHLSQTPMLTGVGFILSGVSGIFAFPVLHWRSNKTLRLAGFLVLLIVALIWAYVGYLAYWSHLASFAKR